MKILVLKQGITNDSALQKGLEIAKSWLGSIGLIAEFNQITTDKQFSSMPLNTDVVTGGYAPNNTEIFQVAKASNIPFNIALLIYDWFKISPRGTNPDNVGQTISIPEEWYNGYPEVLAEFLLHELCHYYFSLTGTPDTTHAYIPEYSQKPRKDYYLYLINKMKGAELPLVNSEVTPTIPVVTLTRQSDDGIQTLGELRIGSFSCKTLERPWKYNMKNISCIPKGTYRVKYTFSPKFLKYTYEILNVPQRSGIRIHSANYFFDLLGCIALGDSYSDINKDGKLDILNSRKTVKNFEDLLQRKEFILIIK